MASLLFRTFLVVLCLQVGLGLTQNVTISTSKSIIAFENMAEVVSVCVLFVNSMFLGNSTRSS